MMTTIPPQDMPGEPRQRRSWLVYQLKLRGLSLAKLSKKRGLSRYALAASLNRGYPSTEIAKALGLKPQVIWPECFDSRGQRIKKKPGRKPRAAQHLERAA